MSTKPGQLQNPAQCVIDCEGDAAEQHRGFLFTAGEDTTSVLRGVTITNGYIVGHGSAILIAPATNDLGGSPKIDACVIESNTSVNGAAVAVESNWDSGNINLIMINCDIVDNIGAGLDLFCREGYRRLQGCRIARNSMVGMRLYEDHGGTLIRGCEFEGNGSSGLILGATNSSPTSRIYDCRFTENSGWGVIFEGESWYEEGFEHCYIAHNGSGGIYFCAEHVEITDTMIENNYGDGVDIYSVYLPYIVINNCIITANSGSGIARTRAAGSQTIVSACTLTGNGDYGLLDAGRNENSLVIESCTVAENQRGGVIVDTTPADHPYSYSSTNIHECTIVGNAGPGLTVTDPTNRAAFHNVLVNANSGYGIDLVDLEYVTATCTDSYGNTAGDWVNAAAALVGLDGNFSADPRFCDLAAGDYHVYDTSPCAAGNHPDGYDCGLIGALSVGCFAQPSLPYYETFDDAVADYFEVVSGTWEIVDGTYHCFNEDPGTRALAVVGSPTWADYRVSMDIRSTGAPVQEFLFRYQDENNWYRFVVQPTPYDQAAIWKCIDGEQDLLLTVQSVVNAGGVWHRLAVEADGTYFRGYLDSELLFEVSDNDAPYLSGRVALSAFADPSVGWHDVAFDRIAILPLDMPIATPDAVPTTLSVRSYPNPFNPSTTVAFSVPSAGPVRLAVYDLRGRLVRTLLSEDVAAGAHEVTWDGRDGGGRRVASGAYVCRVESSNHADTIRMALVK